MNRSKMIEIIVVILGGIITTFLAVNALIKSERQEKELKHAQQTIIEKQDTLYAVHEKYSNELNAKSDEVIRLQKELQIKSESQIQALNNLNNPLPDNLEVTFKSDLLLTQEELMQIKDIMNEYYGNKGNILPINTNATNKAFEKINAFKNIMLELKIEFVTHEKSWTTVIKRGPLKFMGFNAADIHNGFVLSSNFDKLKIQFHGFTLQTSQITSNYTSPTLLDFQNSKVFVSYKFFYPSTLNLPGITSNSYVANNDDYILLNFNSVTLIHKNYRIEIQNLRRINNHSFQGVYKN